METQRIKCGEGSACHECKLKDSLMEIAKSACFTKNLKDRCDWFVKSRA